MKTLRIKRLTAEATLPQKLRATDSGYDLFAAEDCVIEPGETAVIKTGIAVQPPPGYEVQIRPRSGISAKTKLRVVLGTVDECFRGEVGVIVDNIEMKALCINEEFLTLGLEFSGYVRTLSGEEEKLDEEYPRGTYKVRKGDKIAQMVLVPYASPNVLEVDTLEETDRGGNGFGSSGTTNGGV